MTESNRWATSLQTGKVVATGQALLQGSKMFSFAEFWSQYGKQPSSLAFDTAVNEDSDLQRAGEKQEHKIQVFRMSVFSVHVP